MWGMLGNVDNKDGRQLLDSGPGNNWIVHGDEQQGYFGMVAARDFLHRPEMTALLPDNIGTVSGDVELIWLKAAYKGKYLFWPRSGFKVNVTWDILYAAGLVYGVKGPGLYPGNLPRTGDQVLGAVAPVDQLNIISCMAHGKEWFFKVRLFKGYAQNPFTPGESTTGSEWDDLIYRLIIDVDVPNKGAYQQWPSYYIPSYQQILVQETNAADLKTAGTRGTGGVDKASSIFKSVYLLYNTLATNHIWMPVLELVNPDEILFTPQNISGGSEDFFAPPVITEGTISTPVLGPRFVEAGLDIPSTILSVVAV